MTWWQRLRRRGRLEDELDAELRFHFDRLVADYVAEGLPERKAVRRAREEFGGVEAIKDDCRDARGTRWAHDLAQDVRFSARLLIKDRSFTLIAVLALALGIGANNTLFTVVNALCIRGLSFAGVDRLVDVSNRSGTGRPQPLSPRQLAELESGRPAAIDAFAAYVTRPATLRDDESPAERITVAYVSRNALPSIGQRPLLGREFSEEDARPGASPATILGARVWRIRYGADRAVVGRVVKIDGIAMSVVGVMPDGFRFPDNADAWRPLAAFEGQGDARVLGVYGRLSPGATFAEARAGIAAILAPSSTATAAGGPTTAVAVPLNDRYVGDITNPAWIVFITVGLLIVVIACSNVANLLLARGARRGKEMAVRLSLGATRLRIVRQLLVESVMLAAAGGAGAIAVSYAGNRLLTAAIPPDGLPYWVTFTMDARVAAALAVVCLGAVLLFGLAPAVHLARTSPGAIMKETAAGASHDRGAARWTWLFLTCQLAVTVMLLTKLDFTVRGYLLQQSRDPIVDARRVLTFAVALPSDTYANLDRRVAFYRALDDRLLATEPRLDMSVASALPFAGALRPVAADGRPLSAESPRTRTLAVDDSYFRTLGLDVIQGRAFTDTAADAAGIIVNTRFAQLFFAGKDPLGRRVLLGPPPGLPAAPPESKTVIGVVASAREDASTPAEPAAYLRLDAAAMSNAMVIVRTSDDAARLAPIVRDSVRRLDPGIALNRVMTLADVTWNARWNPRVSAGIVISLSLIALSLATIGLAALTAYAVAERRRELGIRLAIGATGASVVVLILKRVARQALVGVAIGSALAKAWDPTVAASTVAAASAVVVAVVLATCAWPAARAARIDPLTMLREP